MRNIRLLIVMLSLAPLIGCQTPPTAPQQTLWGSGHYTGTFIRTGSGWSDDGLVTLDLADSVYGYSAILYRSSTKKITTDSSFGCDGRLCVGCDSLDMNDFGVEPQTNGVPASFKLRGRQSYTFDGVFLHIRSEDSDRTLDFYLRRN